MTNVYDGIFVKAFVVMGFNLITVMILIIGFNNVFLLDIYFCKIWFLLI